MILSLSNGNIIHISTFEYLFLIPDDRIDEFYQYLIAENAGIPAPDDPFSNKGTRASIDWEEVPEKIEDGEIISKDDY